MHLKISITRLSLLWITGLFTLSSLAFANPTPVDLSQVGVLVSENCFGDLVYEFPVLILKNGTDYRNLVIDPAQAPYLSISTQFPTTEKGKVTIRYCPNPGKNNQNLFWPLGREKNRTEALIDDPTPGESYFVFIDYSPRLISGATAEKNSKGELVIHFEGQIFADHPPQLIK